MNRFKLEHYYDQGSELVEDQEGEWVTYEDAAELQRQLAEVTAQRDAYKRQLEYLEGRAPAPAGAPNGLITMTGEKK